MSLPRLAYVIGPKHYEAFKSALSDGSDLPATHDEWRKLFSNEIAKLLTVGSRVEEVVIEPDEFVRWCASSGLEANCAALHAFAVAKHAMNRNQRGA